MNNKFECFSSFDFFFHLTEIIIYQCSQKPISYNKLLLYPGLVVQSVFEGFCKCELSWIIHFIKLHYNEILLNNQQ